MGLHHHVASLLYTVLARIGVVHTHESLSIISLGIQVQDLVANSHHVSKIYFQRSSLRFAGLPPSTCSERDNVVYWKTKRKINDDLQCCSPHLFCTTTTSRSSAH